MRKLAPMLMVDGQCPHLALLLFEMALDDSHGLGDRIAYAEEALKVCSPETRFAYSLPHLPPMIYGFLAGLYKQAKNHKKAKRAAGKLLEHKKILGAGSVAFYDFMAE